MGARCLGVCLSNMHGSTRNWIIRYYCVARCETF